MCEVIWLTGRLVPDRKTIADFRKDNGRAIRKVCTRFIMLCRTLGLIADVSVAIDGGKFKAVKNRDKNFTRAKMERRMAQIEESVARYLQQLDTADSQETSEALEIKDRSHLIEMILKSKAGRCCVLATLEVEMLATPDRQISVPEPIPARWRPAATAQPSWSTTYMVTVESKYHLIVTHRW